jgi:hypothetical protein
MIKQLWTALAAALCCFAPPVDAALPAEAASPDEMQVVTKRLLPNDSDQEQSSFLPLTRKLHAWGAVVGSLTASTEAAGVPPAAMTEALQALATAVDSERDLRGGHFFWVQYEQEYTVEGDPIGTGRVLWAELRTAAKGTVAIHRFRIGKSSAELFWLATGHSAEIPSVHMPLKRSRITSSFGPRADPFDRPMSLTRTTEAVRVTSSGKPTPTNTLGKANSAASVEAWAMKMRAGAALTPLGLSMGLSPLPSRRAAAPSGAAAIPREQRSSCTRESISPPNSERPSMRQPTISLPVRHPTAAMATGSE